MIHKLKLSKLIGFTILASLGLIAPNLSQAFVGTLDTNGEFPFVVRLETIYRDNSRSSCSGVVHGAILSTAAHCLFKSDSGPGHGLAKRVDIHYVDVFGNQQEASSLRLYVPKSYIDSLEKYVDSWEITLHDIGYAVMNREVLVKGYIHWGFELFDEKTVSPDSQVLDLSLTHERKTIFLENLRRQVGDLEKVRVRVVGFGNFECKDYSQREGDCKFDGRRRYGELQLQPNLKAPGSPWIWCTGTNDEGINPIQHGDSGGPIFIQALDGRWIYVGYTSRGNYNHGCASSMFNDLQLWQSAVMAFGHGDITTSPIETSPDDLLEWEKGAAKQFFYEWLAAENAPSDQFLPQTLQRMYQKNVTYYQKHMTFSDVLADKLNYVSRWPERTYSASSVEAKCVMPDDNRWHDRCEVRAILNWTIRNSERKTSGTSQISLLLQPPIPTSDGLLFGMFAPTILSQNGKLGNLGDLASSLPNYDKRVKASPSVGYVNMRSGPGQNYPILEQIPNGERVRELPNRCAQAEDGISKFPFCTYLWNGRMGWINKSGIEE